MPTSCHRRNGPVTGPTTTEKQKNIKFRMKNLQVCRKRRKFVVENSGTTILVQRTMEDFRKKQKNDGHKKSAGQMKPQMVDEIKGKVLDAVVGQKMYRDSNLSAQKLSEALGTNTRYVSLVINAEFGMNYSTFINTYRIEEAKRLLADPRYRMVKMEELCKMVGFANRQSFYVSFIKMVGMTPREYKLKCLNDR
jgi:YesN/AraC family two-component response regulator